MEESFSPCALPHSVACAGSCLLLWHSDTTEEQLPELEAHSKLVEDDGYLVTALGQADGLPRAQRH